MTLSCLSQTCATGSHIRLSFRLDNLPNFALSLGEARHRHPLDALATLLARPERCSFCRTLAPGKVILS